MVETGHVAARVVSVIRRRFRGGTPAGKVPIAQSQQRLPGALVTARAAYERQHPLRWPPRRAQPTPEHPCPPRTPAGHPVHRSVAVIVSPCANALGEAGATSGVCGRRIPRGGSGKPECHSFLVGQAGNHRAEAGVGGGPELSQGRDTATGESALSRRHSGWQANSGVTIPGRRGRGSRHRARRSSRRLSQPPG